MPSSDLTLIFENVAESTDTSLIPVFLLCVFRDESVLLDHFISYYQSIGVTHFIMVDNLSEDNGVDYLQQLKNINMMVYQAKGSYKEAVFGTQWINYLLKKHCIDQYCFTVDVDELFYFYKNKFDNLHQLITDMEARGNNAVPVTLLDMYPKKTNNDYKKGVDFLEHSPFFDQLNSIYYNDGFTIYKNFTHKTGGVRERVFDKIVCIHKFPFFKYNFHPLGLAAGYHFFQLEGEVIKDSDKISLYEKPAVLLHFKFIKPNLKEFFEKRVKLNEDWDNSIEYKSYASVISNNSSIELFDENYSTQFKNNNSLNQFFNLSIKPKISVIIPMYNVEKYIDKCLHSVRNQTLQDIEILCVDDCSPDNSRQIVEKHATQDSRITLIIHEKNLGLGGARNTAIRVAKADFIASVDSDDYMLPDMLKRLWVASEEGNFDVVGCGFNRVDAEGNILSYETYSSQTIANESNSINIFSTMNPAFWNKLWRKSLFTGNNIFFPIGDYFEDMPTTPRLLAKAKKIRIIEDRLYHYFVRSGSISNTFSPKHLIDYFKGFEILLGFLEENNLLERYQDQFNNYINDSIRFHSETVIGSGMNKDELEQYFRQFLMLKIAFFENRCFFKNKNISELLDLLKQSQIVTPLLKHKEAITLLELENADALEQIFKNQNKIVNKEQENHELVEELLENKKRLDALNQKKIVISNELEEFKKESLEKTNKILEYQNLLEILEQQKVDSYLDLLNKKTVIEILENKVVELKQAYENLEKGLMKFSSNITIYEDKTQSLELEKREQISCVQSVGVFLFGILFRPFFSKKQFLKLKKRPRLFFKDSKNKITRKVGLFLGIL